MLHWCAGMYASGSTWTFNVMRGVAGAAGGRIEGRFVNTVEDLTGLDEAAAVTIVKSHDVGPEVCAELQERRSGLCVAIRDPRDAVTSLMKYQRFTFEPALDWVARSARFCAERADDAGALLLRYETGFPDDPATLDRIAAAMGVVLAAEDRAGIFAGTRRAAVEAAIGALPDLPTAVRHAPSGDIFDPQTQWHAHHAGRSGEIGRWRNMLRSRQVRAVETQLGGFMERFGYLTPPLFASGGRLTQAGR